jgi:CHASE3 domain sensor protein
MQKDIRNLFKDEDDTGKKLPESHREEFLEKLKTSKPEKEKAINYKLIYKIAAMMVLFFATGFVVFNQFKEENIEVVETPTIERQIEEIEQQYLAKIETEWQSFLVLAKDDKLIKRFEKRLNELDKDYKELSENFKNDTNNILVIEALVENLQIRLQLLKDIQAHIKLLNQENGHYETNI